MSDSALHLIIPYALSTAPECQALIAALRLPHLEKLLAYLSPISIPGKEYQAENPEHPLSPAHERVQAQLLGISAADGCIPWAAWAYWCQHGASRSASSATQTQSHQAFADAQAHATITLCHWQPGTDRVLMSNPAQLAIEATESQTLLNAMQPFFNEDGIALAYVDATHWRATGAVFKDLATASIDCVIGQNVMPWLPTQAGTEIVRRLHTEMQMLLYTHPVNDARIARGLLPINAFWISGSGALPANFSGHNAAQKSWIYADALRQPALDADWQAWAQAWQGLDADYCAPLLEQAQQCQPVHLTLCAERSYQTWSARPRPLAQRLRTWLRPPTLAHWSSL